MTRNVHREEPADLACTCVVSGQVPFGGELCITPEYLQSERGSSAEDTFFTFMYNEINQGQV